MKVHADTQRNGEQNFNPHNHSPYPRPGSDQATAPHIPSKSLSMSRQRAVSPATQEHRLHENVSTSAPLAQSAVVDVKPKPGDLQDNTVHQQTVPPVASDAASLSCIDMKAIPSLDTEA